MLLSPETEDEKIIRGPTNQVTKRWSSNVGRDVGVMDDTRRSQWQVEAVIGEVPERGVGGRWRLGVGEERRRRWR